MGYDCILLVKEKFSMLVSLKKNNMMTKGFPGGSVVKNPGSAGDAGDAGWAPGSGGSPGGGNATHSSILAGKSYGQRSLVGYSPWSYKESDTTV